MIQLPENVIDIRDGESDDSDWDDDDDDFRARKINIKIKPAGQVKNPKISASVDELRATVDSWKSMANLNHLSKPSSRRSHYQSTVQLNQVDKFIDSQSILDDLIPASTGVTFNNNPYTDQQQIQPQTNFSSSLELQIGNLVIAPKMLEMLPIAFAVQECLNVKLTSSSNNNLHDFHIATGLKGCIKMAVPPKMLDMILSDTQETMLMSFNCNFALNRLWVNELFAKESNHNEMNYQFGQMIPQFHKASSLLNNQFSLNNMSNNVTLSVDMNSIKSYIVERYKNYTNAKYFVLPEIFRYEIGLKGLTVEQNTSLTPMLGYCNWVHETSVTKIRIDIEIIEQILNQQSSITYHDIIDLKIMINFKGTISTHQSKPESNLDVIDPNKLVWNFSSLHEFMQKSECNTPYYSCVARLVNHHSMSPDNLVDDMEMSFKIRDKSVTGASVNIINELSNFKLSLVKSEVRTGSFKVQSGHRI